MEGMGRALLAAAVPRVLGRNKQLSGREVGMSRGLAISLGQQWLVTLFLIINPELRGKGSDRHSTLKKR